MAGWGIHVGALALAPISLVQATIAGGLVMLTVVADRFFAHQVTRREWIGVALAAAGLAFLAATLDGGADEAHSDYEAATPDRLRRGVSPRRRSPSAVAGRGRPARRRPLRRLGRAALGGLRHDDQGAQRRARRERAAEILLNPMALLILLLSLAGLLVSARSLQIGPAVPVIAVTSVAANALHDRGRPDRLLGAAARTTRSALVVRFLAFALVICAAALTPPPLEAEAKLP